MQKIFETIVPGWKGAVMPKQFPAHVRFALRASVLLAHVFAIKRHALPFGMISNEKRTSIIETIYHHPNAAIRNIVQFWKLTAFMTQC